MQSRYDSYAQARERFLARRDRRRRGPVHRRGADRRRQGRTAADHDVRHARRRRLLWLRLPAGPAGRCADAGARARFRRGTAAGARGQSLWLFVDRAHRRGQRRPEPQCPALRWPSLPENPGYGALHPLLLPESWPPTEANQREQERYIAEHGLAAYAQAVSRGQYTHADGLFYGGDRPAASLLNMRRILKEHAADFSSIGWIDVHTGWGRAATARRSTPAGATRPKWRAPGIGTARTSRCRTRAARPRWTSRASWPASSTMPARRPRRR